MPRYANDPWLLHITKHKSGVWKYDIRTEKPHNPAGGLGTHLATCNGRLLHVEEIGRLMAAAPILLAACERAEVALDSKLAVGRLSYESEQQTLRMLQEAIAKAKTAEPIIHYDPPT